MSASAATRAWTRLIKHAYEVNPLVCSRYGGAMRILAFIEQPEVIALPVPGTWLRADTHRQAADREDPDASRVMARASPQSARPIPCRVITSPWPRRGRPPRARPPSARGLLDARPSLISSILSS